MREEVRKSRSWIAYLSIAFIACAIAPAALAQMCSGGSSILLQDKPCAEAGGKACPKATLTPADCEKIMREAFVKMYGQATRRKPSELVAKNLSVEQTAIALAMIQENGTAALALVSRSTGSLVFPIYQHTSSVTPLNLAARWGDVELMRAILAKGAPVDSSLDADPAKRAPGTTALSVAMQGVFRHPVENEDERVEAVKLLVAKGANVRARDATGQTALGLALVNWGNYPSLTMKVADVLIPAGADVNEPSTILRGAESGSALTFAAYTGIASLAQYLLDKGADPRANHSMALKEAVKSKSVDVAILLLRKGANPNSAIQSAIIGSFDAKGRQTLIALFEAGANPNTCDYTDLVGKCGSNGRPPLFLALDRGDLPLASALVRLGADANAKSGSGDTLLGMVLTRKSRGKDEPEDKFDRLASVTLLLYAGADPNLRSGGVWPLSMAEEEDAVIIGKLLDRGAKGEDVRLGNGEAIGPITMALSQQKYNLARELMLRNKLRLGSSEKHALRAAVADRQLDFARKLVAAGADCKTPGPAGETPLHVAAQFADAPMVALLVACGADANARTASTAGAQFESRKSRSPRLDQVVPATPRLVDGLETPLMVAATADQATEVRARVAKALLAAGANPLLVSEHGKTALALAHDFFNTEVERELSRR